MGCDLFEFPRKAVLAFIESKSEITWGEDKVVKIDESMIRERKYQWGHKVKDQWVFGGIEIAAKHSSLFMKD